MSGPRTKRPFAGAASDPAQRQITSFFSRTSSSTTDGGTIAATTTSPRDADITGPLSPALPPQVQANLLSVGMRIRKSVPEGYKTGTYAGFSLWSDNNNSAATNNNNNNPADIDDAFHVPNSTGTSVGVRELAPFCGLHKVGGLAVQPSYAPLAGCYSDNMTSSSTSPISSQESNISTSSITSATAAMMTSSAATGNRNYTSSSSNARKRVFEDMSASAASMPTEHHSGPWRNRAEWFEAEISPKTMFPQSWGRDPRIIAVPSPRVRGVAKGGSGGVARGASPADQENVGMVVDDFEEAEFLEYEMEE